MAAHSALNGPRVRAFEYAGPDFEVSAVGIVILAHTYLNNQMKGKSGTWFKGQLCIFNL